MCLILFSYQPESPTPLILGANRDEFFKRESKTADYWTDAPQVLAGRDLVAGGTWLGMTTTGRFAAVTNVREPQKLGKKLRSRGDLTREYLCGDLSPKDFLEQLEPHANDYSGFNLLVGEFGDDTANALYYFSNRREGIIALSGGTYGLSNHLLDSPWPKVEDGKRDLEAVLKTIGEDSVDHDLIRQVLENPEKAADHRLPDTGVGYEREKNLSPAFITLDDYGTRTSTVLVIDTMGVSFSEQNYRPSSDGQVHKSDSQSDFSFLNTTEQPRCVSQSV